MVTKTLCINNYEIRTTLDDDTGCLLASDILTKSYSTIAHFRDNEKCLVKKLTTDKVSGTFILKIPKSRFSRNWERFLTLFRDGEPFRQFNNMKKLKKLGFCGPTPIVAAQKRHFGVVIDGFIIYEYIDGRPANADDAQLITPVLVKLLALGYIRKDPQPRNFIISGQQIYFIDFNIKKPMLFNRVRCLMEFCKHLESVPEGKTFTSCLTKSKVLFNLAFLLQLLTTKSRSIKRKLKLSFINMKKKQ